MQIDDMKAIDGFFRNAKAVNTNALSLAMQWRTWYDNLSAYEKAFDSDILAQANARRAAFNKVNISPKAAAAQAAKAASAVMSDLPASKSIPLAPGTRPTIKQGSKGPFVIEWQNFLGIAADGAFGPQTHNATTAFQRVHGLTPDGIVGANTWGKAIGLSTGSAATQAAKAVADVTSKAAAAVVNKPAAVKPATAAKQSAQQTLKQNAQVAAQQALDSLPKAPSPVATATTIAVKNVAAKAKETANKAKTKATVAVKAAPIWTRFAVGTAGVIAVLAGAKVLFGGKRAA